MNQSGRIAALGNGDAELAMEPGTLTSVNTPGAAAQASATVAAPGAGKRHICRGIHAAIACAGTAQTPIRVVLRDNATGTGNVLWSKKVSAPINGCVTLDVTGLCIPGVVNQAMTLEFVGAGVAASEQDVTLAYVTVVD